MPALALRASGLAAAGAVAGAALASAVAVSMWPQLDAHGARLLSVERRVTEMELHGRDLDRELAAHEGRLTTGEGEVSRAFEALRDRIALSSRESERQTNALRDRVAALSRVDAQPATDGGVDDTRTAAGFSVASIGRGEFLVARSALAEAEGTLLGAGVVPHEQDGLVIGLRIGGVRPGSLASRLGLRNGDTAVSLNGRSLSRPAESEAVAQLVRDSTTLELLVLRRGRPVRLRYSVIG